jgi:NAD+ synthase (glutamine-hydrolysing)
VPAIVGTIEANRNGRGRPAFNAAAVCHQGRIVATARKCLLPTYDVFDEDRYFEPADHPLVWEHAGRRIGLSICEDIWTHQSIPTRRLYSASPVNELSAQKLDLVLNLSASPWHSTKENVRRTLVADLARACRCPAVYVNAVGGQDELLFDGRSLACDATGRLVAGLPAFREDLRVVDLAAPAADIAPTFEQHEMRDIYDALVLGVRDYAHKTGFKTALLGLSGGIDSALVAVLAAEALGPQNVIGVSLPSAISSQHSRDDAATLAKNLGIRYDSLAIADVVAASEHTLASLFAGRPRDIAEENIQARARGLLLMAVSNKFGSLLLTTGNKSELAVGYCTLYGDMCGGLAVISDVFKTQVYTLSRWINRDREIIPANTIAKAPSAELRPDQTDQDSLPPYDLLDAILKGYIEEGLGRRDLIARGFDAAVVNDVARKVDLNEYKRKQAAPGLKITPLAFGVGRRIPIVQRYVS